MSSSARMPRNSVKIVRFGLPDTNMYTGIVAIGTPPNRHARRSSNVKFKFLFLRYFRVILFLKAWSYIHSDKPSNGAANIGQHAMHSMLASPFYDMLGIK